MSLAKCPKTRFLTLSTHTREAIVMIKILIKISADFSIRCTSATKIFESNMIEKHYKYLP